MIDKLQAANLDMVIGRRCTKTPAPTVPGTSSATAC